MTGLEPESSAWFVIMGAAILAAAILLLVLG